MNNNIFIIFILLFSFKSKIIIHVSKVRHRVQTSAICLLILK